MTRTTPYCTTPAARVPNPRPSCRRTASPIWPNAITSAITSAIHKVTEYSLARSGSATLGVKLSISPKAVLSSHMAPDQIDIIIEVNPSARVSLALPPSHLQRVEGEHRDDVHDERVPHDCGTSSHW